MRHYKVLKHTIYAENGYSIVPIRSEDRYHIMKWRNEQLFHLRQEKPLTKEAQDVYFETVVKNLFIEDKPNQLLFSYLEGDQCIGYGGLVHINWIDKNAEISFITETPFINKDYEAHLLRFLGFVENVASTGLNFHKLFTYAFDVRPEIYAILEKGGFKKEAVLKEHCFIDEHFLDVIIHSKFIQKNNLKK